MLTQLREKYDRVRVVSAEARHCALLAQAMRTDDRAEMVALGMDPRQAVWRSFRLSGFTKACFVDGQIAAMWGCGGSPLVGVGEPWLMTTRLVECVPVATVKTFRAEVATMLTMFYRLWGYVPVRYSRACRILRMSGFTLSEPFPFGPGRSMFHRYDRSR